MRKHPRYCSALLLILSLLMGLCPSLAEPSPIPLSVDLQRLLNEERLAGAVFATVTPQAIQTGAVGVFNMAKLTPLKSSDKVQVGSITKTVLALSLLRLSSQGRLDLDEPVTTILPDVHFPNPWAATHPVSVRHLLDHTAGLEDIRLSHLFNAKVSPDSALKDAFSRDPSVLTVRTRPGAQYTYSNLGYTLAALVLERIVKERYETWADRELLGPLGMTDSSFGFRRQDGSTADVRLAWGHQDDLSPVAAMAFATRPAGQFTTTASDMARLAQFLMGDGQIAGQTFIQPALLNAMGQAQGTIAAQVGLQVGYGLGLATRDRYGAVGQCHAGSVLGYRALLCLFKPQQRAFFIAYNTDSETARHHRFEQRLVEELGVATTAATPASTPLQPEWQGRYVPVPGRFKMAALADVLGSSVVLSAANRGAFLTPAWGEPKPVWVRGNLLQWHDRRLVSHVLALDTEGHRTLSDTNGTLRQINSLTYVFIWTSVLLGLLGLTYWLFVAPVRFVRNRTSLAQPAFIGVLLLFLPIPFFFKQPWIAVGDLTMASGLLYGATWLLPLGLLLQATQVYRERSHVSSWKTDLGMVVCAIQFCGLLWVWDLLPVALWR